VSPKTKIRTQNEVERYDTEVNEKEWYEEATTSEKWRAMCTEKLMLVELITM